METLSSRIAKVFAGACLIVVPLTVDGAVLGDGVLLPLIAIPLVFAGIFDWRPMELIVSLIARAVVKISPEDVKLMPTNAL